MHSSRMCTDRCSGSPLDVSTAVWFLCVCVGGGFSVWGLLSRDGPPPPVKTLPSLAVSDNMGGSRIMYSKWAPALLEGGPWGMLVFDLLKLLKAS